VKIASLSLRCPPLSGFPLSGRTPIENGSVSGGKVTEKQGFKKFLEVLFFDN
jgi:hypothetical protein